jgi:hypothetical protein
VAKDHFVPQHYLRQFGVSDRSISVVTLSPYRFIKAAPIDGQCQEDNFYEKNEPLNRIIWQTENDFAPLLVRVSQKQDFDLQEANALKFLAVVLHMRTRKAAETAKLVSKHIACEFIRRGIRTGELPPPPEGEDKLEEIIDFKGATAFAMSGVIRCWMETRTLECKLLHASSERFITSDNPVCILNQFCGSIDRYRGYAGFARAGFQLLMPITPELCFFCYDGRVYKVGNRRDRRIVLSNEDVEIVNSLQVQSAGECLYLNDPSAEGRIRQFLYSQSKFRRPVNSILDVIPGTSGGEEFLHLRSRGVRLPSLWRFCRYRRHVKTHPGDRRDPLWSELSRRVVEDIEKNPQDGDLLTHMERVISVWEGTASSAG